MMHVAGQGMGQAADPFAPVFAELDIWAGEGQVAKFWLRDDDAMAPSPALERLLDLAGAHQVPLMLAVIPMRAETTLPPLIDRFRRITVAMHGAWHRNHAAPEQKSCEMTPDRGEAAIMAALREARQRLRDLFGPHSGHWYVPPWNRLAPEVAGLLPAAGFGAVSVFGRGHYGIAGLHQLDCHVDLIDWRGGRKGRSIDWIAGHVAAALADARTASFAPVGILTHHLDHDQVAWAVLEQLIAMIAGHPQARWAAAQELLR